MFFVLRYWLKIRNKYSLYLLPRKCFYFQLLLEYNLENTQQYAFYSLKTSLEISFLATDKSNKSVTWRQQIRKDERPGVTECWDGVGDEMAGVTEGWQLVILSSIVYCVKLVCKELIIRYICL